MANNISHFNIYADDVLRARKFYESVFGWKFSAWGPPDFFLVQTGPDKDPGIHGALAKRQEPLAGTGVRGFECSISVTSLENTTADVVANGGTIVMPRATIPTVGSLIKFHDTEGNIVVAIEYEAGVM